MASTIEVEEEWGCHGNLRCPRKADLPFWASVVLWRATLVGVEQVSWKGQAGVLIAQPGCDVRVSFCLSHPFIHRSHVWSFRPGQSTEQTPSPRCVWLLGLAIAVLILALSDSSLQHESAAQHSDLLSTTSASVSPYLYSKSARRCVRVCLKELLYDLLNQNWFLVLFSKNKCCYKQIKSICTALFIKDSIKIVFFYF